jgi:hypothetical protein
MNLSFRGPRRIAFTDGRRVSAGRLPPMTEVVPSKPSQKQSQDC